VSVILLSDTRHQLVWASKAVGFSECVSFHLYSAKRGYQQAVRAHNTLMTNSTSLFTKLCALHKSSSHYSASWNSHFSGFYFTPLFLASLLILLSLVSVRLRPVMSPTLRPLDDRRLCSDTVRGWPQRARDKRVPLPLCPP